MPTIEERVARLELEHTRMGPGEAAYPTVEEVQKVADRIRSAVREQSQPQKRIPVRSEE